MTKKLLIAALLSTAGAVAFAQAPAAPVAKDATPAVSAKAGKKHAAKKHGAKKAAKPAAAAASK